MDIYAHLHDATPDTVAALHRPRDRSHSLFEHEHEQRFMQIKHDPTILFDLCRDQLHHLILWFCSMYAETHQEPLADLPVLHCLLTTDAISVNDPLRLPFGEGTETALSLAVMAGNIHVISYLLKMGASPDVLVGFDPSSRRPSRFAFDRINGNWIEDYSHVVALCERPVRNSLDEVLLVGELEGNEFVQLVQDHDMVSEFTPGIEYDVAEAKLDPTVVEGWTKLHCAFVFARLVRRRPSGPIPRDYFLVDLLLASGKVSVNDYLVISGFERVTALHSAVVAKNVDFVRYLLHKHHADPNRRSYVDGMPWNDMTHIVYPLSSALRAFSLWDDGEEKTYSCIVDLLLEAGTRTDVQVEAINAIMQQDVMAILDLKETMHFCRMLKLLIVRTPGLLTQLQMPLSHSLPILLSSCEQKWMKLGPSSQAFRRSPRFEQVFSESLPLIQLAISLGGPYPKPEILMALATSRSHLTLASLAYLLGDRLPLDTADPDQIRFLNPYTEEHAEAGLAPRDVYSRDAVRVTALINVLVRSTAKSQRWMTVLKHLHAFILIPRRDFPVDYFSLKNLCMAVVNDMVRGRVIGEEVISRLPKGVQGDVRCERELDSLSHVLF